MVQARKCMCVVVVGTAACVRAYTHKAQVYKYIHIRFNTPTAHIRRVYYFIYTQSGMP